MVSVATPVPLATGSEASSPASPAERVESFVRQHYAFTWRVLRRCGLSAADADDAAQRVFMIATQRLDDIQPGSERGFLFRTAAHIASKSQRAVRRRPDQPGLDASEEADHLPLPDMLLDQQRARALLDAILAELAPELRAVFILFEIEGLRSAEVADALQLPVGTVASRLRRARQEVSERVARYEARARFSRKMP